MSKCSQVSKSQLSSVKNIKLYFSVHNLVVFLLTVQIVFCTNYCDPNLCKGRPHIACNHTGKFASTCNQPSFVKLSKYEIEQILDLHNTQRNTIASGNGTNGLKSAAAMPILVS